MGGKNGEEWKNCPHSSSMRAIENCEGLKILTEELKALENDPFAFNAKVDEIQKLRDEVMGGPDSEEWKSCPYAMSIQKKM